MSTAWLRKIITPKTVFFGSVILIMIFLGMRVPLDPDLGWHLRSGQYIWEHKALASTDPFSHTFPEYPWIAHEWLSDLTLYGLNSLGTTAGPIAMSVVFSLIAGSAFYIAGRSFPARREYQILAALLALLVSLPILGVRPQMISMLGLALVFYIVYRFRVNERSRAIYFLPLLFAVWVNFHGGFSLGLFALAVFWLVELLRAIFKKTYAKIYQRWRKKTIELSVLSRRSLFTLAGVGLVSGAATLINPYGLRIYYEVYNTFINTTGSALVRQTIGEWTPVSLSQQLSMQFNIYLILFGLLLLFAWKKINFTHLCITAVFFYLGMSSWRNLPLLMISITPFWVMIAQHLTGDTLARIVKRNFFLLILVFAAIIIGRQQITGLLEFGIDPAKAADKGGYPYAAVQYLKARPLKGEMLNEYNYGGYLVWNYPERKVFIDGRMAIWELNGKNVYLDWMKLGHLDAGWEEALDKYNVSYALVRKNLAVTKAMKDTGNWETVYEDAAYSILVRRGSQE